MIIYSPIIRVGVLGSKIEIKNVFQTSDDHLIVISKYKPAKGITLCAEGFSGDAVEITVNSPSAISHYLICKNKLPFVGKQDYTPIKKWEELEDFLEEKEARLVSFIRESKRYPYTKLCIEDARHLSSDYSESLADKKDIKAEILPSISKEGEIKQKSCSKSLLVAFGLFATTVAVVTTLIKKQSAEFSP